MSLALSNRSAFHRSAILVGIDIYIAGSKQQAIVFEQLTLPTGQKNGQCAISYNCIATLHHYSVFFSLKMLYFITLSVCPSVTQISQRTFATYPVRTRFVGKPEGVSNVFLTYFDYFLGDQ